MLVKKLVVGVIHKLTEARKLELMYQQGVKDGGKKILEEIYEALDLHKFVEKLIEERFPID